MAVGDFRVGYHFDWLDGFEPYVSALGHLSHEDDAADTPTSYAGLVNLRFRL